MSADSAPAGPDELERRPLPHLSPVQVLDEEKAEDLVRAARAGLALLSLQLRSLPTPAPAGADERDPADAGAAEVLLRTSLERTVDVRRIELRDELEQVRADAAAHVAAARHEAATIVADATDATLQVLLQGVRPVSPGANLRVVTDDHAGRSPVPTVDEEEPAPEPEERVRGGHPASGFGGAALEGSVTRAVSAALAEVFAAGQAAVALHGAPTPASTSWTVDVAPPPVPGPSSPAEPAAAPATASRLRRFLYVDVVLPMIAVLIVLVILLAWVG